MNRHVQARMLALAMVLCGCAGGRAALPPEPDPTRGVPPMLAAPSPEPVRASIDEGKIPRDLSTVRASHVTEAEPQDEAPAIPTPEPLAAPAQPRPATPPPGTTRPEIDGRSEPPAPAPPARKPDAPMSLRTDPNAPPGVPASRTAAVVGDTILTYRELKAAVCQRLQKKPHELAELPPDQLNEVAKDTLDTLIDRTLILQEGRRVMKADKWTLFTDYVEKAWEERELPSMMRRAGVDGEIALRRKMEEAGESLDDAKDSWKMEQMSRELLMMQVQPKVEKPGLPEMEAYYAQHRNDPSYHRDAKVKWREIVVAASGPADLPAARKKALALRDRIVAGEDFARLAKAESAGGTAAKGGAWETAPDGTAVPAVNAALASLAPGRISDPIEGPKGFHLIRVESRRQAGIATFVEVQREIANTLYEKKFQDEISAYLKRLHARTSITSPLFQGTRSAPTVVEEKAKVDGAARRTSR